MMKSRFIAIFFALVIALGLTSCRYRVTDEDIITQPEPESTDEAVQEAPPEEEPEREPEQEPEPEEEAPPEPENEPEPDVPSVEDESADRKEYDSSASAEVSEGADNYAVSEEAVSEENVLSPTGNSENQEAVFTETETETELTVTETVSADESKDLTASEEGEVAESSFTYYTALLTSRLDSQFECQKLYVYWETEDDHVTVHKTSKEHELILLSGAYDASAKLLEDALTVDDGWIARKNPGAIVKVISDDGFSANAPGAYEEILGRTELSGTDAVKNGRIIVLSDDLLSTSARRVAAAVYIAKLMYPDKLSDIDADEALALLTEEDGNVLTGTYTYIK